MKNLKLLNIQKRPNTEAECFCQDYDGNVYLATVNEIQCLSKHSNNVISMCSDLVSEVEGSHSLIGIEYIIETDKLFIASSSGEIYLFDIYSHEISTVGVVDSKIKTYSWSPDQEFLIILTGADTLILMTKDVDPICEKSLCPDEFGESEPITVGWGSKETQFHGSEGKGAAKIKKIEPKPALPYDNGQPHVSWRGDGEYFVTSSIHPSKGYRQLRIWSREAVLQFTGEIKDGLEESVCWRPLGNLIVCSQQDANKHKIIFFEKNGLQHGEFALPFKPNTYKVTHLLWNSDSTILMIGAELIENPSEFQIMLWTCGNYHWYLKQKFCLQKTNPKSLVLKWSSLHPHELLCLNQTTQDFYELNWTSSISSTVSECGEAIVASIDNDSVLVTPFENMVVPPPMCAYSFTFPLAVQSIFFSPESPQFCCYLDDFKLALFHKEDKNEVELPDECKMKLIAAGGNGFKSKVEPYNFRGILRLKLKGLEADAFGLCHWTWLKEKKLLCVCSYLKNSATYFALVIFELPETVVPEKEIIGRHLTDLECSVSGICTDKSGSIAAVQLNNGKILRFNLDNTTNKVEGYLVPWLCEDNSELSISQMCVSMSIISICGKVYFLGLTERFSLYCNKTVILSNCTSYYIHEEYLLVTTTDHLLKFFLIDHDLADLNKPQLDSNVQIQKVEKGAKIVISPINSTKVILQMPRGNLETLNPRPLVLSRVCKHLDRFEFDKAFELAKVHRIDLNLLYDHNPKGFLDNVLLVVDQLKTSTNLNLFLASLKNEDICETLYSLAYKGKTRPSKLDLDKNKIDVICDSVREVLEVKKDDKLFLSLIATYAKKSDPELEKALIRLKEMKNSNPNDNQTLVDSALNFLLYLVNVNELIDVALGTYDLEITVMVAQKSQKDPKEFLPFYNELLNMEENYRKYKIDMHLQRYKLALQHISKCEEHFDKCLDLIRDQRLYIDSLYLFPPSSDRYKVVWKDYGNYLMEKRYYDEAGLVFTRCGDYQKALIAYKESLNWQSMLCAAMQLSYSDDRIVALCIETAEKLKSNQKYLEASYLLEQYVKDIEDSIVTLIEGHEWNAALLMISKYSRHDVAESHLRPALLEHHAFLESHLDQLCADFKTYTERLKTVRSQKQKEAELPDIIKHHDEELFSETDSVIEGASSCAESKQLSGSIMTRKSSKSRRKQKLKKYRLKEGSADEDLALIMHLSEIVTKIDNLKDNFLNTLKTLVQFGNDQPAKLLQQKMTNLIATVESNISNIWLPAEKESKNPDLKFGPDATANSITALLLAEKKSSPDVRLDSELAPPLWRKLDVSLQMFK